MKPSVASEQQAAATVTGEPQKSSSSEPLNWPGDVQFLPDHSLPSSNLPPALALHLCTAPKLTNELHPSRVRSKGWTIIKEVTLETPFQPAFGSTLTHHPTLGQCGLFARVDVPPHTLVVPYLGTVHLANDDEEDAESRYDAAITGDDGTRCGIDATKAGNEARFVNDYRGILTRPNVFFQDYIARLPPLPSHHGAIEEVEGQTVETPKKVKGLALYSGAHSIKAGTELCASYGKGWWAARCED